MIPPDFATRVSSAPHEQTPVKIDTVPHPPETLSISSILISFFRTIPVELEEAARIDGYGWFGILLHIVLPLSGAAVATIGLYTAVFFWNDWFYSLIYLKDIQYPAMLVLRNIVSGSSMAGQAGGVGANASLAIAVKSAVIIITTIPPVLIYPFLQKHFVKGMTIGAVKG